MTHAADPPPGDAADEAVAAGRPAADLGEVWNLLDALPPATASVDLAATTVELVAAKVAGRATAGARASLTAGDWAVRVALVGGALLAGLAFGRRSAPDPDRPVLEKLPLIEHLDILREVGSVSFLEAVAARTAAVQAPPRWLRAARDPEDLRVEAREFDAALAAFADWAAGGAGNDELLEQRRRRVAALPAAQRSELERSAEAYRKLTSVDRRDLTAVARALGDPANGSLRDAARLWHLIVAAMNPVFRRNVVEMPVAERLEFMERSGGRFDGRPPIRPRDDGRDRRPPEPREGPQPPARLPPVGPPRGGPGTPAVPGGAPGSPRGAGPGLGPAALNRPQRLPAGEPPAVPGETRAPPR